MEPLGATSSRFLRRPPSLDVDGTGPAAQSSPSRPTSRAELQASRIDFSP
jgi:hypothetical protein